jgi:uncharacterized protein YkwD
MYSSCENSVHFHLHVSSIINQASSPYFNASSHDNNLGEELMTKKYNLPLMTTVAMICIAVSGCGSDSESNTSSTNDIEQRAAAKYSNSQNESGYSDENNKTASKQKHKRPRDNWRSNNRPIADITGKHTFLSGETITLDGTGSYDEDGDSFQYFWGQANGPKIVLDNRLDDTLTFIAPQVTEPTQFVFYLIIFDGKFADLSGFSLQVSPVVDNTPPSILHHYPASKQANTPTKTEVSVTFNEALSESSINDSSLVLIHGDSRVPGNVSYDDISHTLVFSPNMALQGNTQYRVTLKEGVQDIAGNLTPSESWQFVTAPNKDDSDDNVNDKPNDNADNKPDSGTDSTPDDNTDSKPDSGTDSTPNDDTDNKPDSNINSTPNDDTSDQPNDNQNFNLGATTQDTINKCMNDADKQMLTLVNNARAQTRSCGTESYQAAAALSWNCRLESAAHAHSASMAKNNYFSHTGKDGSSPGDRISNAGYAWMTYGENIAAGYRDAESVMDGWLTSPGHCANLMNPKFKDIGVGIVNGSGSYGIYWTQDFAAQ